MKIAFLTINDEYLDCPLPIESLSLGEMKVDVYYNSKGPTDTMPPKNHYPIGMFLPRTQEEVESKTYDIIVICDNPGILIQLPISCSRVYLWLRGEVAHPGYKNVELDDMCSKFLYNLCYLSGDQKISTFDGIFCTDNNNFMKLTEMYYKFLKNKRNRHGNIFVESLLSGNNASESPYDRMIKRFRSDVMSPSPKGTSSKEGDLSPRIPTFVVNLDRRNDRWIATQKNLKSARDSYVIDTHRFSAIDPRDISHETNYKFYQDNKHVLRLTTEYEKIRRNPYICAPLIKPGEIGCFMSHYKIWKDIATNGSSLNDTYLILEDDVYPVTNFEYKFSRLFSYLYSDAKWNVCFIGSIDDIPTQSQRDGIITTLQPGFTVSMWNPAIKRTHGGGTYSYLIRKKGAQRLVECVEKYGVSQAVDWFMLSMTREMMMYKTSPHLFISDGDDSDIQRT